MSERLHLAMPLEVDGWEVIESLEGLSLFDFDGYRDLTNDAIAVLHEVQGIWREHRGEDGEWSGQATGVMSEVLRLAYNIRQSHQRYGEPLSDRIRFSVGLYGELNRPGFLRHFPGSVNVASQTLPVTAGC